MLEALGRQVRFVKRGPWLAVDQDALVKAIRIRRHRRCRMLNVFEAEPKVPEALFQIVERPYCSPRSQCHPQRRGRPWPISPLENLRCTSPVSP